MRRDITAGMTRIEHAYRDLEMVMAPPADARDARKELASFAATLQEVAQQALSWSVEIRDVAARGDTEILEAILRGETVLYSRPEAGPDDDGV